MPVFGMVFMPLGDSVCTGPPPLPAGIEDFLSGWHISGKNTASFEQLPADSVVEFCLHGAGGSVVGKDFEGTVFADTADPPGVVAVLVSEENGVDLVNRFATGFEEGAELTA